MSIIISSAIVLAAPTDPSSENSNNPVIGYDNVLLGAGTIAADTEFTPNLAANLTDPATHTVWEAGNTNAQVITVITNVVDDQNYLAIARHNLGSLGLACTIEGSSATDTSAVVTLHFNDVDASTSIIDSAIGSHAWTATGNAQIDTSDSVYGGSSLALDGTGDYVTCPSSLDFNLGGTDFTIEMWFHCTKPAGTIIALAGQRDAAGTVPAMSWELYRFAAGHLGFDVGIGGAVTTIVGVRQFTDIVNVGWHHVAITRNAGFLVMWIDGALEAFVAVSGSLNNSTQILGIGIIGAFVAVAPFQGWIDDFRMTRGLARYLAPFILPSEHSPYFWTELVASTVPADDSPVIFRFSSGSYTAIRLRIAASSGAKAHIAVMYVGKLLILPRRIYVGHVPIPYGRRRSIVTGYSEKGNFLGRVQINETKETAVSLKNILPDWYRTYMDPFIRLSGVRPFFFAWRPGTYPLETGYCWMTNDPQPQNDRSNGMMKIDLKMSGIGTVGLDESDDPDTPGP